MVSYYSRGRSALAAGLRSGFMLKWGVANNTARVLCPHPGRYLDATQACCACGGGSSPTYTLPAPNKGICEARPHFPPSFSILPGRLLELASRRIGCAQPFIIVS